MVDSGRAMSADKIVAIDEEILRLETELTSLGVSMPRSSTAIQAQVQAFVRDILNPIVAEYGAELKYNVTDGPFESIKDDIKVYGRPDGQWLLTPKGKRQVYLFFYAGSPFSVVAGAYGGAISLSEAYRRKTPVAAKAVAMQQGIVKAAIDAAA